jgi:hypothetical protein
MPVRKSSFEAQTNVFYLTGWGHSGDHWLSKALNAHPEIFVINCYEPTRLKYFNDGHDRDFRPDILTLTAFLEDIGTDYKAIGECHAFRASQMSPIKEKYGDQIPTANLVRHPYTWLDFYIRHRVNNCRMPGRWSGSLQHEWDHTNHSLFKKLNLKPYLKDDVYIWSAYQGMWLLHNIVKDAQCSDSIVRIEELLNNREHFVDLAHYLTFGKCSFTEEILNIIYAFAHELYRGEESYVDEFETYSKWPDWKKAAFEIIVPMEAIDSFKKIGYEFEESKPSFNLVKELPPIEKKDAPIIVSSMMKSGTWMIRKIIVELTGLKMHEPSSSGDIREFEDASKLVIPEGFFYSWHFFASDRFKREIIAREAKVIFLYRNIADALVSMYYHFINDIDADYGYPTNNKVVFNNMARSDAMTIMITGFNVPPYYWAGSELFFKQMLSMILFSYEYPVYFVSYERLLLNKADEIEKLSRFIEYDVDKEKLQNICDSTSFHQMQKQASTCRIGEKHFRKGAIGDYSCHFDSFHHKLLESYMFKATPELPKRLTEYYVEDFLPNDLPTEMHKELSMEAEAISRLLPNSCNNIPRILLYGINRLCRTLLLSYCGKAEIIAVSDSYKHKYLNMFYGSPSIEPSKINKLDLDYIIICATSKNWPEEIYQSLRSKGVGQKVILKSTEGTVSKWIVKSEI